MDKYQRLRKIGEGAFGKAFLVRHKGNNRQCVVKEINIVKMSPKEREEARKEVAVLAQLKHPNIVAYIESFEESGTLHIVMNYCAGGDLYSKINSQRGVLFSEEQIWNWFVQICLAMKHIHDRKILHRDIKSQNIFLTTSGAVQLGDFGIAKVLNNTVELARTCIGTPYYLSPEIVENKPYNNKSDIWSLGCVLYELTTHKHAFEAGNMKNLVLKIIRGSYPPIPPQYSYDLRGLIAQLLKRAPRDRPSINSVLQKNIIMQRVRSLLSAEQIADEFSHTVMHGAKVAKALPPGPRPSSAPKKEAIQRPASAGRKYNPAAVYGRPLSARKSQGRSSGDLKKKAGPGDVGNRPLPVPGQMEWEQKKKEMLDKEQKRREDLKKQQQEEAAQRHNNFLEKQKMDRINKSKEEGWKNLVDSLEDNKESPQAGGDARPLPIPKQLEHAHPNFLENRKPRQAGNYEEYIMYLDKLKNQRIEREKALDQRAAEYMQAPKLPAQQNNIGNGNGNNLPSPAVYAVQQANYNRQKAVEAAERARVTEDYIMRRREAAMNKARGQAELYGYRPPSGAGKASPSPRPGQARPALPLCRNKEEQEYLQKLRQIRDQNMHERRAIKHKLTADDNIGEKKEIEAEQRRKKVEALRQQADDWAKKKKEDLEQEKQKLLNKQFVAGDQAKRRPVTPSNRPGSARSMQPAPPVPITGVLQVIGVRADAAVPPAGKGQMPPQPEEPQVSCVQQKKNEILKKLNEQSPARGKWGAGGADVPLAEAEGVEMRGKWGKEVVSPLAATQADSPGPESSRPQWDKEEKLRLSAIPLEQTASQMEATSARDQVIRNPKNVGDNPCLPRNQWGRPGSTVVKALNKLPVCEGTMTPDSDGSQEGADNSASPGNTPPAIGSTVTLSKGPTSGPVPTPVPSARPPIRSGTITIKAADAATVSTTASSVEVEKLREVRGKGNATTTVNSRPTSPDFVVKATLTILPIATDISAQNDSELPVGEVELPGSNRFVQSEGPDSNPLEATEDAKSDRLQTVLEVTEICSETEQFTSEDTKTVSSDKTVQAKENLPQEQANLEDEDKSTDSVKPQSPMTPAVNKKPKISQKPRPLPKPNLLLKPDKSFISSEQGSDKPTSVDVGDKTAKLEQQKTADHKTKQQLNVEERSHSVQKGLTTGNYDLKDIQMLRTCSEPDLTRLFRTTTRCVQATLRRHQSLDMEEKEEAQSDDSGRETEEDDKCDVTENVSAVEKDRESLKNKDNSDEDTSEFIDDDDEELMNLRETMQSFLIDNDDDPGTPPVGTIKFSLSASGGSSKDDEGKRREAVASGKNEGRGGGVGQPIPSQGSPVRSKSDSLLVHGPQSGDGGDNEEVGEPEEEVPDYNVAEIFDMDDSDEETVFGDEDGDSDFDLYSRLEHQRAELERELGFEKFIQVYKTVQALQEDEDENMEEGARIAIAMLGPDKQNLYPRIFQLVMADTAFTEDNV